MLMCFHAVIFLLLNLLNAPLKSIKNIKRIKFGSSNFYFGKKDLILRQNRVFVVSIGQKVRNKVACILRFSQKNQEMKQKMRNKVASLLPSIGKIKEGNKK